MQVLLGYFVTPPMESLGAGYKTGNKLFLVLWGPLNTSRPVACFQHEIPTGAIFLTYAPRLFSVCLFVALNWVHFHAELCVTDSL